MNEMRVKVIHVENLRHLQSVDTSAVTESSHSLLWNRNIRRDVKSTHNIDVHCKREYHPVWGGNAVSNTEIEEKMNTVKLYYKKRHLTRHDMVRK